MGLVSGQKSAATQSMSWDRLLRAHLRHKHLAAVGRATSRCESRLPGNGAGASMPLPTWVTPEPQPSGTLLRSSSRRNLSVRSCVKCKRATLEGSSPSPTGRILPTWRQDWPFQQTNHCNIARSSYLLRHAMCNM